MYISIGKEHVLLHTFAKTGTRINFLINEWVYIIYLAVVMVINGSKVQKKDLHDLPCIWCFSQCMCNAKTKWLETPASITVLCTWKEKWGSERAPVWYNCQSDRQWCWRTRCFSHSIDQVIVDQPLFLIPTFLSHNPCVWKWREREPCFLPQAH